MDNTKYNSKTNRNKLVKFTLLSVLVGELVTIVTILVFAIVMSKFDIPHTIINLLVIFAAVLGGFVAGNMNGRATKQKGIIMGGVCGVILSIILILVKMFAFSPIPTGLTLIKLMLVILASAFGGIMGVNKKSKRIKY